MMQKGVSYLNPASIAPPRSGSCVDQNRSFKVAHRSLIADRNRLRHRCRMTIRLRSQALSALSLAVALTLSGCFLFSPVEQVVVPLPLEDAIVRVEVWGNTTSEGRFEVSVQNHFGAEKHFLWDDWGPAQRASLYLAPDRRLVVLGGGGIAEMIIIPPKAQPHWLPYAERPKESGDEWKYLGAIDRDVDHLVFYAPSRQRECIPLYGAGSSPYRKSHQNEHSC